MIKLLPPVSPRWVIFLLDLFLSSTAFLLAYGVSEVPSVFDPARWQPYRALAVSVVANTFIFYVLGLNKGIIRYTGFHELGRLLLVGLLSTLFLSFLNLRITLIETSNPLLFWLGYFTFFVLFLGAYRAGVKYAYHQYFQGLKPVKNVAIYGADDLGAATKAAIGQSPASPFRLALFIDDNPKKHSKRLDGIPIGNFDDFTRIHARKAFDTVIISTRHTDPDEKKKLLDFCLEHNIKVLKSPPIESWTHKKFRLDQLQRIRMQPCSLEGADCNGEMQLSASIIPMYAEILSGTAPSGQISLFLLDLEAAKPYILSKPLQVNFPVKLDSDPIRALEYRMVRMENDPVSGVLKFSTETVPVSISTDGSRGSAQISNVNADWMLVAQGKLESSTALTGFSPVAKSVKPGKGVSTTVTLGTVLDPLFADLMGLTNPEIALKEAIEIAPLRNKTTEVSMNIMVRKINLRNPATNGVIFSIDNMPNYPVGVKRTVVIPHDSGGA